MPEVELSPLKSLLIMSDSGLCLLEKSLDYHVNFSSELVSSMFSALISFFEGEIKKGNVQTMEFSDSTMFFDKLYNLILIVEFGDFIDDNVAREIVRSIILDLRKAITREYSNPNKYIPILKGIDVDRFFSSKWQSDIILSGGKFYNLFDDSIIAHYENDKVTYSVQGTFDATDFDFVNIMKTYFCGNTDPIHIHDIPELGLILVEFWVSSAAYHWLVVLPRSSLNIIKSHERLLFDYFIFLNSRSLDKVLKNVDDIDFVYYVPLEQHYKITLQDLDLVNHGFFIFHWCLGTVIENYLTSQSFCILADQLSYLAFKEIIKIFNPTIQPSISPYYQKIQFQDKFDIYFGTIVEDTQHLPLINLYQKTVNQKDKGYHLRDINLGDFRSQEDLILYLENELDEIQSSINELFFLLNNENRERSYEEYKILKNQINNHQKWNLIETVFLQKFSFLQESADLLISWKNKQEISVLDRIKSLIFGS